MEEEMRKCESLAEMLAVLNKYYDCDRKLGPLYKNVVLTALPRIINAAGLKKR